MSEDERMGDLDTDPPASPASEPAALQDEPDVGDAWASEAPDDPRDQAGDGPRGAGAGGGADPSEKRFGATTGLGGDRGEGQARSAAERHLVYRPTAGQPALSREVSDLNRWVGDFLDMVACDAQDRGARVIFLLARSHGRACAHRLATAFGDNAPLERLDTDGLGNVRPLDFLDAVKLAVPPQERPVPRRERVIIDSLRGTLLDAPIAVVTRGGWLDPGGDGPALEAELERLSCRLVVHVELDPGQPLLPVLEDLRDAIVVPWTGLWLMETARRHGFGADVLAREIGGELRSAARITDVASGQREAVLHLELSGEAEWQDTDTTEGLKKRISSGIDSSTKGRRAIAQKARVFALQVLHSDDVAIYGGPIGRTILLTALLIPDQPTRLVLDLCRRLLPQGPAYSECLTAPLLEIWLREADNDRSLARAARHPPAWGDLFEAVCDRVIDKVGLMVGPKQKLKLGATLAPLDVGACLAEQTGRLVQLTRLLLAQARAVWLPVELLPVLVDLACALRRLEGEPLAAGDLPLLFAGTGGADRDLGLPQAMPSASPVPMGAARTLMQLRTALQAKYGAGSEEAFQAEEEQRTYAASRLRHVLELWCYHPEVDEAAFSAFLSQLSERITAQSTLTLLAFLVLHGPVVEPLQLGRLTVECLGVGERGHFASAFRYLRETLHKAMMTATSSSGDTPMAVDTWADALWHAARVSSGGVSGRVSTALAVWMDDMLSTWEIPVIPSAAAVEDRGADEPCLFSRLMIRAGGGPEHDDLLTRLFLCTPEARLAALKMLEEQTGKRDASSPALRMADLVRQRVADVVWIMIGGVDKGELARAGLTEPALESVVWGAIGSALGRVGLGDRDSAVAEILKAREDASTSALGDPRAVLDLYAPAVLLFWRLQRFGTRSLSAETKDHEALKATLSRVRGALERSGQGPRIGAACKLLMAVETELMTRFEASDCPRTRAHHARRLYCLERIAAGLTGPARDAAAAKEGQP